MFAKYLILVEESEPEENSKSKEQSWKIWSKDEYDFGQYQSNGWSGAAEDGVLSVAWSSDVFLSQDALC